MISVILTAYNRREYLKYALDSLKIQSIKNFEIVLITNFNFNLEGYKDLNIRQIIINGSIGEFIYHGVMESHGDILVFMDDDDTFTQNKMEYINDIFKNESIGYFHNYAFFMNSKRRFFLPPDFNSSCISIRKNILIPYMKYLNELITGPDSFLYLCALSSKYKSLNKRVYLTYYNDHKDSASDIKNDKTWLLKDLNALQYMKSFFNSDKSLKYLNKLILGIRIKLYLFYGEKFDRGARSSFFQFIEIWLYFFYTYGILDKKLKLMLKKFLMQF